METIFEKQWSYKFGKEDEDYFLEVVCGSVGIYEIKIQLNDEEIDNYKEKGKEYIENLVSDIQHDNTLWLSRVVA